MMWSTVTFAELQKDDFEFHSPDGGVLNAVPEGCRYLVVSRLDCHLSCLEVPRASPADLEKLVRYRSRANYPGNIDGAEVDFSIQREEKSLSLLVAIMSKTALESYRAHAGNLRLLTMASLIPRTSLPTAAGSVIHLSGAYIEVLRYREHAVVESTLLRRGALRQDLLRAVDMAGGEQPLHILAFETEVAIVRAALLESKPDLRAEVLAVGELQVSARGAHSLFESKRAGPRGNRSLLIGSLSALLLVVLVAVFYRDVDLKMHEAATYRRVIEGTTKSALQSTRLASEAKKLRGTLASLESARPPDLFQMFSELRSIIGPDVTITDFQYQSGTFQLQAQGKEPLTIIRGFAPHSRFHNVRLLQTSPGPSGGVQVFTLTGEYR